MKYLLALALLAGCGRSPAAVPAAPDAPDPPTIPDAAVVSTMDDLRFAIVGDTRPPSADDTANYPTAIITKIWQDVEAESPHVPFALTTGDYIFADTNHSEQMPQFAKYMDARAHYTGTVYPAMGNHECTGYTDSNCGPGATDGVTANYTDFMSTMLQPIGETSPYYVQHVAAKDNSWTMKLVVLACNAWDSTQASWLDTALAESTTYTFVLRHEGVDATTAPCVTPSAAIIAKHPLTLLVVGHTHTYRHYKSDREIVVGNGGAPLTSGMNYGYVIAVRNADGTITFTAYDYDTHAVLDTFSVHADGTSA